MTQAPARPVSDRGQVLGAGPGPVARGPLGRVEPLPDPFVLSPADARRSPLHGRMVFVIGPESAAARARLETLRQEAGTALLPGPTGLCAGGIERPWSDYFWVDHQGPAVMADGDEMLRALRGLADDLLLAAARRAGAHDAARIVEWSPAHGAEIPAAALVSLYPDAAFLRMGAPDEVRRPPTPAGPADTESATATAPAPSPLHNRLIVIVGAPRSGTTWLEELCMAHPRIGGIAATETWLFEQLSDLWSNPWLGACVDRHDLALACRRYGDALFRAALQRHAPGADYFVEKSPVHSMRIPQVAASYPDAWFVHIVRDGRDVARSASAVPFFELAGPADGARMWKEFVEAVRAGAPAAPRLRQIRYEDLFADPVAHMRDLFTWMGLGADPTADDAVRAASAQRVSTHAGTAAPVGPGSWRDLTPAALAGVYRHAGDLLVAEGYVSAPTVWRARLSGRSAARAVGSRVGRLVRPRRGARGRRRAGVPA